MVIEFISLLLIMAALQIKNLNVIFQFVVLEGMTGALAPFSYLVLNKKDYL
jgi:uncharacterized MnhB-related membrane protein